MADELLYLSGKKSKIASDTGGEDEYLKLIPKPYIDPITKTSQTVAPIIGRFLGESIPAASATIGMGLAGPPGAAAGTGAGTMLLQILKSKRPDLLGEAPQGFGESLLNLGKEEALNVGAGPALGKTADLLTRVGMISPTRVLAKAASSMPVMREGIIKSISKQLKNKIYPETGVIEQGAENAVNRHAELSDAIESARVAHPDIAPSKSLEFVNGAPVVKEIPGGPSPETAQAMEHLSNVYGQNNVGGMLIRMQKEAKNFEGDIARTQTYKEITNNVLRDVTGVQNAKLTGGEEFTRDLATNKILVGAGSPAEKTIDAAKALAEMGGKNREIYQEAMGDAYGRLQGLLEEMAGHQQKNTVDTLLRYSNHKLLYSGVGLATGGLGGAAVGLGLSSALPLTDRLLRKAASNPETIKLIRLALKTPVKSPQAVIVNRALEEILPRLFADTMAAPER